MSELSELPSEECSSSESVFVGYRQELVRKRKTKYNVNGRDIVIFYLNGNFHAMDRVSRKLRPSKHRPQTSDLENPDLENPDLENPTSKTQT